jgi:hypothetical protein
VYAGRTECTTITGAVVITVRATVELEATLAADVANTFFSWNGSKYVSVAEEVTTPFFEVLEDSDSSSNTT